MCPAPFPPSDGSRLLQAFERELLTLLPRLRRFARALARDAADADDILQVALERALKAREQWAPGTRLDAWMMRIVRNCWIDEMRSRARRARTFAPEEEGEMVGVDMQREIDARAEMHAVEPGARLDAGGGMMTIDDDMLMAFVDGELDEVSRARVERAIAEEPDLKARLEQQQRLRDRLAAHYGPAAEEEVPERFRAMLESSVLTFPAPRARPARPLWQALTALAATLVLGQALALMLEAA